jgi:PKD repeat protein
VSPASPTAGNAVTFDASPSADPDGSIAKATWDFGDGATGSGTNVWHMFADAGTYTVTLTVADDNDLTATTRKTVTVAAAGPTEPPVLSKLKITPSAFRAAAKGASIARKRGARISYTMTLPGTVILLRDAPGRRVREG